MALMTTQPTTTPTLDSSGLGKGIQMLLVPSVGTGLVDLVTGDTWSLNGGAGITTVGSEKHFAFPTSPSYLSASGYAGITGNVGTFFAFYPIVGDVVAYGSVFISTNSPSTKYFQMDNYKAMVAYPANGTPAYAGSWFNTTGRSIAFTCGGAAASTVGFIDGATQPASFPSSPASWGSGVTKVMNIGRWAGGGYQTYGTCSIIGWTSEVWTSTQAAAFHANPWQMFIDGGGGSPGFGYCKVSGLWKPIASASVNVSGTWKSLSSIKPNVSGSWKSLT